VRSRRAAAEGRYCSRLAELNTAARPQRLKALLELTIRLCQTWTLACRANRSDDPACSAKQGLGNMPIEELVRVFAVIHGSSSSGPSIATQRVPFASLSSSAGS
jgi:invasion protein IalB